MHNYNHQHANHVLDFYLWQEVWSILADYRPHNETPQDFDLTTEQREGWAYD